jgi:hypothetical protein
MAMSSTDGNHVDSIFIDPRLLIALRSPVLYEDLFGKYEQLLNMCKDYISLFSTIKVSDWDFQMIKISVLFPWAGIFSAILCDAV